MRSDIDIILLSDYSIANANVNNLYPNNNNNFAKQRLNLMILILYDQFEKYCVREKDCKRNPKQGCNLMWKDISK